MKAKEFWDDAEKQEGLFTKKDMIEFAEAYAEHRTKELRELLELWLQYKDDNPEYGKRVKQALKQ